MKTDTRKLSLDALAERRRLTVELDLQGGLSHTEIAARVGANRKAVGLWIADYKVRGAASFQCRPRGRPTGSGRWLTPRQELAVKRAITDTCPDQLKMPFALWTREAVREVIRRKSGLTLPIRTVGLYLQRWEFTPQKPTRRSYERVEEAVRLWMEEMYPAIKARAKAENAEIHWGDQTGLRSTDQVGRGYAPRGHTPVRHFKGTPEKVNLMSTVTNQGLVRFMLYGGSMNARVLLKFLTRLVRSASKKIFLILDNMRVHHARKVKAWLAQHQEQIEVFYLPSYSPDLNPDEYLNCDLKAGVSARPDRRERGGLKVGTLSHLRKLQKSPARIRSYFKHPCIRYAA